jgi:hypothetical protein
VSTHWSRSPNGESWGFWVDMMTDDVRRPLSELEQTYDRCAALVQKYGGKAPGSDEPGSLTFLAEYCYALGLEVDISFFRDEEKEGELMTDIDKIEGLRATIAELRQEKERLYINVANRDKELARLNIRIRQDAEAALQHLNEIDRLHSENQQLKEDLLIKMKATVALLDIIQRSAGLDCNKE